jgi:protein-tyrosine-phosphatase
VPDAIEAMRELGIDISGCRSKSVTPYLGQQFTYVISL